MITQFKIFESIDESIEPKMCDWIIDISGEYGEIEHISKNGDLLLYHIIYSPECTKTNYMAFRNEIEFIGTEDEVKMEVQTRKYNL